MSSWAGMRASMRLFATALVGQFVRLKTEMEREGTSERKEGRRKKKKTHYNDTYGRDGRLEIREYFRLVNWTTLRHRRGVAYSVCGERERERESERERKRERERESFLEMLPAE
jgi:hypothetical protein